MRLCTKDPPQKPRRGNYKVDHNAEAERYIAGIVVALQRDGFSDRQIAYLLNRYKTEPPIQAVVIMCETDSLLDKLPRDRSLDSQMCCLARILNIQFTGYTDE